MRPIFIDGVDNTGKTTLAKVLSEETGWPYVYSNARDYETAFSIMKQDMPHKVQDRFFTSELVFGEILRGQSGISPEEAAKLASWLRKNDATVIFCVRSQEKILETFEDRPQLDEVKAKLPQIMERYWHVMNIYCPERIVYNFDLVKMPILVQYLKKKDRIPKHRR